MRTITRVVLTLLYSSSAVAAALLASFLLMMSYALWLMEEVFAGMVLGLGALLCCVFAGCCTWLLTLTWGRRCA